MFQRFILSYKESDLNVKPYTSQCMQAIECITESHESQII